VGDLSVEQLHILQHSLGLDEYGRGTFYRNRYVVGPGCDGYTDCRALVDLGFMVEHPPRALFGGMSCFCVTDEGRAACVLQSPRPPKASRGRRRYHEWLRVSDVSDITFGEWMKGKRP